MDTGFRASSFGIGTVSRRKSSVTAPKITDSMPEKEFQRLLLRSTDRSWFNTSVTKTVQYMGDNLAMETRVRDGSGCLGKNPGKWTRESNL